MLEVYAHGLIGQLTLHIDFKVNHTEPLVLIGPNGAGKTTALHVILGFLRLSRSLITLNERVLSDSQRGIHLPPEARNIGYVPQNYALFPHCTVLENVAFGVRLRSARQKFPMTKEDVLDRATHWLQSLEVEHLSQRRPTSLSGGEQQRVALARALASEPEALLLDEPMAALDLAARSQLRRILSAHIQSIRLPTILVTHDPEDAAFLGKQVAVMEMGGIVQIGSLFDLQRAPATTFVKKLADRATWAMVGRST